jgi:hypothetical protein
VVAGAGLVGIVLWAHHLSYQARNGENVGYEIVATGWVVVAVGAIVMSTRAAIIVIKGLEFSAKVRSVLRPTAVGVGLCMVEGLGGMVTWWVGEAQRAPGFLANGLGSGFLGLPGEVPLVMVMAGVVMTVGVMVAVRGLLGARAVKSR